MAALAVLIRPSGYFNAKARKLKAMAQFIGDFGDDLDAVFSGDTATLRRTLLAVHGVGPETADSILLYVAARPVFVIDAYTRRILRRLGLAPQSKSYSAFQYLFMESLPHEEALFNEYHALLVRHGKTSCRKAPLCSGCCLREICPSAG